MSGVLAIGKHEREHIAIAIEAARKRPVPWELMMDVAVDDRDNPTHTLNLSDRKDPDMVAALRREYAPQRVQLGTYEAAISFEEQPAGTMKHLSVAARSPGKVPNEHVLRMVMQAFGFSAFPPLRPYRIWIEEFERGHHAINVVELEP